MDESPTHQKYVSAMQKVTARTTAMMRCIGISFGLLFAVSYLKLLITIRLISKYSTNFAKDY